MSLPTLPKNEGLEQACGFDALHYHEAIAYGQQCRDAALEEAAVALETGDVSGLKDDAYMRSYTTHLLVSFAKYFRSLK